MSLSYYCPSLFITAAAVGGPSPEIQSEELGGALIISFPQRLVFGASAVLMRCILFSFGRIVNRNVYCVPLPSLDMGPVQIHCKTYTFAAVDLMTC